MLNFYQVVGVLLACAMHGAIAQGYPSKAIRIVVPASTGSGVDTMGRMLARELSSRLGQAAIVENMPGAGGNIATVNVARSAADGHTLLFQFTPFVINPSLYRKAGYDPVRDFEALILVAQGGHGMFAVNASTPRLNSVSDLVALSKAKPGQLNYATPGYGTPPHLQVEIFKRMSGADLTHVPYKTTGDAINAILTGDVIVSALAAQVAIPQAKSGKLRILASTGQKRWVDTPDVPTLAEAGYPEFKFEVWYGFLAPAGTPGEIVRKLNAQFAEILTAPAMKDALYKQGQIAMTSTPEEFAATIKADQAYWARVIKETGISIE